MPYSFFFLTYFAIETLLLMKTRKVYQKGDKIMKKKIKVSKVFKGLAVISVGLQVLDLYKYESELRLLREMRKERLGFTKKQEILNQMRDEFKKRLKNRGIIYYSPSMNEIRYAFEKAMDDILFPGMWDKIEEQEKARNETEND